MSQNKNGKEPKTLTRKLLSNRDRETMMSVLIRNPDVFNLFRDQITKDHFGDLDVGYAFVWQIVCEFYNNYELLPDRALLMSELDSANEHYPDALNDTERSDLEAFVDVAFNEEEWDNEDLAVSAKYSRWAVKMLKKFLEERLATKAQELIKTQSSLPVDLPSMLLEWQTESEQIAAIQTGGDSLTFSDDWDKSGGINMFSTGLSFFDKFLGGGHAPSEVYGLLGPYGSCKTTLGVMLAVCGAHHAATLANQPDYDGKQGYAIYVSYEARLNSELRFRSLSYAAYIRRASLETMGPDGIKSLSTWKTLKPYEKAKYKKELAKGNKVPGEQARAKDAITLLNNHTLFIDMTGSDPERRGVGGGGVDEIARIISWEMRKRKGKPVVVIIDYVGAMARRNLASTGKDDSHLRHLIAGAPLKAKNMIADQFNVPCWLLHQLNGTANDKSPGAKIHHTDAAEAKSFGENLDFAFVLGSPTASGLCQLANTKHRRTGAQEPAIIEIVGNMNCVNDTGDLYTIINNQIVENKIAKSVGKQTKTMKGAKSETEALIEKTKAQGKVITTNINFAQGDDDDAPQHDTSDAAEEDPEDDGFDD